ncbi:putative enoyl-CoA hydratase echA12 [Baekduia alba]|uniref:enoyl-CoA hydratase/isomerase family protein n=1 Tax=Baekduia alba TaxID=2997333 RepID=UPI002341E6ED|nr:enoyl-CoA hydratase/isomerase family protein [Baekduia alba]WCB91795.1 putative enoyl-CoA hydratase echA12 [Baekduia alba]
MTPKDTPNDGEPHLKVERPAPYVLRLTLNRPRVLNALSEALRDALITTLREVRDDPSATKAVIFTGAGDYFCSGGDVTEFADFLGPRPVDGYRAQMFFQELALLLLQLPCPVIGAINGPAHGGGTAVAMMTDLRIVSDRASFRVGQVARGLVPDVGLTWVLPRVVGTGRALELMLLNEELSAAAAERIGLVNRVVPHDEVGDAALEMATKLAASSRTSLEWIKRTTYMNLDLGMEPGFRLEAMAQALLSATDDFEEGLHAFKERRAGSFK